MSTQATISANLVSLGFTNASQSAIYNKIAEALGTVIDNTLTEFTNTETSIVSTISNKNYGKSGYYTAKALAFQYGDNLTPSADDLDPTYAVIDTTKQIVKQAAFESLGAQLFLKVATVDINGNTAPLSADQLTAFSNYFLNFEIPGRPITIISANANILSFNAICTYNSAYDFATMQANIANMLNTFMQSFALGGKFIAGNLSDYLKTNVPGIVDFYIYNTTVDAVSFLGSTALNSGYFNYITNITNNITYQAG